MTKILTPEELIKLQQSFVAALREAKDEEDQVLGKNSNKTQLKAKLPPVIGSERIQ